MDDDKLYIACDYPHSLLMHITAIFREKNIENPEYMLEDDFIDLYEERYLEFANEVVELVQAKKQGILQGFIDKKTASDWQKRVFISVSIAKLIPTVREFEAVELMESLMFLFHWEMQFEVKRKWECLDKEKAWYHNFSRPGDIGFEAFERKAKEYLTQQTAEKQEAQRRCAMQRKKSLRSNQRQHIQREAIISLTENTVDVAEGATGREEIVTSRRKRETSGMSITLNKRQDREMVSHEIKNNNTEESLLVENLTEEKYRQELERIQIKHENLMSLSLRKEIKRAKRGNQTAQCQLGDFYAEPDSKHTDYREAVRWYGYAARQGNHRAKYEMGRIFTANLIPGLATKEYGIKYFMDLANSGYPTAQYIIGMKYYLGDYLEKDINKGVIWLKKAAYQGVVEAQKQLAEIYANSDEAEADKWLRRAKNY